MVEKFVLQLEAQLADRDVTIELSRRGEQVADRARLRRADGRAADGARIQEHIKKPLADEVLFGKLKAGGHVRVVVVKDENGAEKLGFEFLDGPVTPKPEKLPVPRRAKPKRRAPRRTAKPSGRRMIAAAPRLGAEGAAGQGVSATTASR